MKNTKMLSLLLALGLTASIVGCGKSKNANKDKSDEPVRVAVVNTACPMTGGKINQNSMPPKSVIEYNGRKVGFCCPSCIPKWKALSDDEKKEKYASSLPPKVAVVNARCPMMTDKAIEGPVAADMVREFNGQKVGFCCPPCGPKWDALSDDEKKAKLAAVMTP